VCHVSEKETSIVVAAKAWACALATLEKKQRRNGAADHTETAELTLYDAIADVDALKSAEHALYQAVLASGPMPR
jgi:hypothetical protein